MVLDSGDGQAGLEGGDLDRGHSDEDRVDDDDEGDEESSEDRVDVW